MTNELETLKARADKLGIEYGPNISIQTLKERIEKKLSEGSDNEKELKEQLKLVRVIVSPMHASKAELEGEIFTVSNSLVGTVKKFVPFGLDAGYHIPKILLDTIKDKKVQVFTNQKVNGTTVRQGKLIPAYNVVELPPLSQKELDDLAKAQRARQSVEA